MNTVISFVIVLGLLIFVHEFGHFLAAKLFGVRVLTFSLGFGPKLLGRRHGDTEYVISAFPLGGYVKMFGENPGDETPPAEARVSFAGKPVWQRFLIVAAGPVFNLAFAVVLFCLVFLIAGLPQPVETTMIGQVNPDSAAEVAGLRAGDAIVAVEGRRTGTWEEVSEAIGASGGREVEIVIERDGETLNLRARPTLEQSKNIFGETVEERYMLGIVRSQEVTYERVSPWRALTAGLEQTWTFIYLTLLGIVKIIQKVVPASELGGPILIAQLAGQQMEAGWINFCYFIGLISVNLGILNLLPIPILDGGHLVFFTVEAIQRKPVHLRTMEIMQQIGLVLLGSLMIYVFYNDLVRIFG